MSAAPPVVLELIFTGICAFVRLSDGHIAAVMPRHPADPAAAHMTASLASVPHHVPWMIVSTKNSDGTPFDVTDADQHHGRAAAGAWILGSSEVWIEGASGDSYTYEEPGDWGDSPAAGHVRSVHWVAPFQKIFPGTVKATYQSPGRPEAMAFWFRLPSGAFATDSVRECVWDFKAASGKASKVTQSLAQQVSLTTRIAATDAVTVVMRDLYTGEIKPAACLCTVRERSRSCSATHPSTTSSRAATATKRSTNTSRCTTRC